MAQNHHHASVEKTHKNAGKNSQLSHKSHPLFTGKTKKCEPSYCWKIQKAWDTMLLQFGLKICHPDSHGPWPPLADDNWVSMTTQTKAR